MLVILQVTCQMYHKTNVRTTVAFYVQDADIFIVEVWSLTWMTWRVGRGGEHHIYLPLGKGGKATDFSFLSSAAVKQFFMVSSSCSSHLSEPHCGMWQWMTNFAARPVDWLRAAERKEGVVGRGGGECESMVSNQAPLSGLPNLKIVKGKCMCDWELFHGKRK